MKKSRFSEEKVISILKELEAGAKAAVKHKQDSAHPGRMPAVGPNRVPRRMRSRASTRALLPASR